MVPKEKRDKHLPAKLKREASGILNWLLDGLRDWLDRGLVEPTDVEAATAQYRADSDPLGRFLADCIAPSSGDRVQATGLHRLFVAWAAANGERAWTAQGLGRALRERGFTSLHSNVNWWVGMKAIKKVDEFVDHEGVPRRQEDDGAGPGRRDADEAEFIG